MYVCMCVYVCYHSYNTYMYIYVGRTHNTLLYLFQEMQNVIEPLEGGSAVAQPHGTPEVHGVEHQVAGARVELVSHGEPLLSPDKLPLASADKLQDLSQRKVAIAKAIIHNYVK